MRGHQGWLIVGREGQDAWLAAFAEDEGPCELRSLRSGVELGKFLADAGFSDESLAGVYAEMRRRGYAVERREFAEADLRRLFHSNFAP